MFLMMVVAGSQKVFCFWHGLLNDIKSKAQKISYGLFQTYLNTFCQAQPQLNSFQLNFNFNLEAEIALFSDNTATHPTTHPQPTQQLTHPATQTLTHSPSRESTKMEQDFKYFN